MSTAYAVNPLAGLPISERKRIMESLNSNSNSNTTTSSFLGNAKQKQKKNSGPLPPVYARNPYPGLTMSDLNTNSNSNSNTFTVPEYKPSAIGIAFKQAVLNRMKQKEAEKAAENARRYKSKYPPVYARNPYPGLNLSNLNTNSNTNTNKTRNKAANKRVSFAAGTKQRKTRKLPKNCKRRA